MLESDDHEMIVLIVSIEFKMIYIDLFQNVKEYIDQFFIRKSSDQNSIKRL